MQPDERVLEELSSNTRFKDVRLLDQTDSTNRVVADAAAAGAAEGLVVWADHQTAGRGRLDRTWEAAPGDALLVSVLLRPGGLDPGRWHLLTAAVALAAADACAEVASVEPDVKWPNDLLVGGEKLAGILAEVAGTAVVVGMGLNVHDGPPGAAVLDRVAGRRTDRWRLLAAWLRRLDGLLDDWDGVGRLYRQRCATLGGRVAVDLGGGRRLVGVAQEIDEGGRLVVTEDDGAVSAVSAGDVVHLRTTVGP